MISSPPSEMLVQKVSDYVKLNCSSSGSPLPKVKWLKDGKVISEAGYSAVDLTMSELIISSFKPSDTGLYICRFYNSKNSTVEASTNLGMSNSYPVCPEVIWLECIAMREDLPRLPRDLRHDIISYKSSGDFFR